MKEREGSALDSGHRPKMAFQGAALRLTHFYSSSSGSSTPSFSTKLHHVRISRKKITVLGARTNKRHPLEMTRSALGNRNPSIGKSEYVATDLVRVLLERFFVQTHKLEDWNASEGIQIEVDHDDLESNLQAVLVALKEKEQDLKDTESRLFLAHAEINRAKQELEQREKDISAAQFKQEKIEEDLKQANDDLAAQVGVIENLKLVVKERDREIIGAHSALSLKEAEFNEMRNELIKVTDETARMESDIKFKDQLLNEANEIIKKQAVEVQELNKEVNLKKQELKALAKLRRSERDKLKLVEAKLEKQTVKWLSVQQELKRLTEEARRHMGETTETLEDFKRVKQLLTDMRHALISSQQFLAFSQKKMEEQEHQLYKKLRELQEQKVLVISHMKCLEDAAKEV